MRGMKAPRRPHPSLTKQCKHFSSNPPSPKGKVNVTSQLSTVKKVLRHIGRYRWLVLLSLLLSAATVVLTLVVPILVGRAIDGIVGAGADMEY